jgi:UDP-N-acetyl-D-glucosamine dehydrogenase
MRESPALDLIHLLAEQGARVDYHDPFVPSVTIGDVKYTSKPYSAQRLRSYDAVVVTTGHAVFNAREILNHSKLLIDTRNMMRGLAAKHLIRL